MTQVNRTALAGLMLAVFGSHALAQHYDVRPQAMPLIPPGTVIGEQAPRPWTNMILKSHPRCTQGDVTRVSRSNITMAKLLSTSLLARVQAVDGGNGAARYRLASIAGGVSTKINGRDVIISPDTQKQLGAGLSFLQGILLKEFYSQQKSVTIIAHSSNFAVFDTPIVLRRDNRNKAMVLRYAVLVRSDTGRLDTLCWPIDKNARGEYLGVAGPMQWLPQNKIVDCQLWVDASEYTLGIPSKTAFACVSVPQGQVQVNVPPKVGALLAKQRLGETDCEQAQHWLEGVVQQAQAALERKKVQ